MTTLADEAHARRYTVDEILDIVDDVLACVADLHGYTPPFVHGAIDPTRIERHPDGKLVLGLGDAASASFGYAAPELVLSDPTAASDLYAVGALTVALLCRVEPKTLATHDGRLDWRPHAVVSPAIAAWIDDLVDRDPQRRPLSATIARQRLATARRGGSIARATIQPPEDLDPKHLASGQIPLVTAWIALHLVPAALLIGSLGLVMAMILIVTLLTH